MNDQELFERSLKVVPGGVHSPVRSFKGIGRAPKFFVRGEGAFLFDTQGDDYIDFCMSFGPLIWGHRPIHVEEKLKSALNLGTSFGTSEIYSLELAEYITDRLPLKSIRFVNSGTEAVMTAIRIARGFTKREKIIKFAGCYHGHCDSMLIAAGSGVTMVSEATSLGVPTGVVKDTLVLPLGDELALVKAFEEHGSSIAAVIIEPLPANNGLLPQKTSFLKMIRKLTQDHSSLLIFDEVISGLRVAFGGMTEKESVIPDIMTLGKVIGGGLPVGAVLGREDIMNCLAPTGDVYQAGTLSANPLAMIAGLASLQKLTSDVYERLEDLTQKVVLIFREWLASTEFKDFRVVSQGSLFWIHPGQYDPISVTDIPNDLGQKFPALFNTLLEKGVYLSPNGHEVGFVSMAHDERVLEKLKDRLWNSEGPTH